MIDSLSKKLLTLLDEREYTALSTVLGTMYSVDIAEVFDEIDDTDAALRLFRLLPKDSAADAFAYMDSGTQERIIEGINDAELSAIINDMFLDDCVDLVDELPSNVVKRIMASASPENRKAINLFLSYPENSAGSLMTTEYIRLRRDSTAEEAISLIRETAESRESIDVCYVAERDNRLVGSVALRTLVLAEPETLISELMNKNFISAVTATDREEVALLFSRYDMLALPVTDAETRLVGIITIDDVVDVIQKENTEDFELMAGVTPTDDEYLKTPVFRLASQRIIWLIILMVSAVITEGLINSFQEAFSSKLILVAFIPMLMDTGGNSGSQSSTIIIRGMALEKIAWKDFFTVLWKELRIAFVVGLALAAVNFLRVYLFYPNEPQRMGVALAVSLALVLTVLLAKALGCILPMTAKRIGLDPAIMSAPLITTVTDACSIIIFFTLARLMLGL